MTEIDYFVIVMGGLIMGGWLEWRINKMLKTIIIIEMDIRRFERQLKYCNKRLGIDPLSCQQELK